MARKPTGMPSNNRISDAITIGILAKSFPLERGNMALAATGKTSLRKRELPAHVMVYNVLAMALFLEVCCREVLRWLLEGAQRAPQQDTRLGPPGILRPADGTFCCPRPDA